jgi:hypothetical protein
VEAAVAVSKIKPREMSAETRALLDEVAPREASEDKLTVIRALIAEGRSLDLEIESMEAALKEKKRERYSLLTERLPKLFEEAGVDKLGIEAENNLPAYDTRLKSFYKAVLPPRDEPERRDAAVEFLRAKNAEDLLKTEVVVEFGRGDDKKFAKLRSFLEKQKMDFSHDTGVNWNTLTSWMREQFESGRPLSQAELQKFNKDPETQGAAATHIVELKKRKEK